MTATAHPGPLAGLKVLELTQIMSGPTCGLMLADLGADVVKVEKMDGGDDSRGYGGKGPGAAGPFLMVNRNKRGLALDLKHPRGREVLLQMARRADVLVENFRTGTMDKLGLGYPVLSKVNPALIVCSITGYGLTGPLATQGGFDLIAQGFAGLMSITGEPGREPAKTGNAVSDMNAGILAALGIVSAYVHRLKTGQGQLVDTSLAEAALQQTCWHAAIFFASGRSPGPTGSAHVLTAPYQAFQARDGWLNIGGANQNSWERVADVLGHPEWKTDARFASNADRMLHREVLVALMTRVLATRGRDEWIAAFNAAGVPAGPVHSIEEALTHPQTLAREMVVETDHPQAGRTRAIGCPVKLSATPARVQRPAPLLGQHTREVLAEYGFDGATVDALLRERVVGEPVSA